MISSDLIGQMNHAAQAAHEDDFASLGRQLARRGLDIQAATQAAMAWSVAIPTWGVGTGGTRFARFPGVGEPRNIHDKLADCGVIQALTRGTRTVSPHIPWDKVSDYNALRQEAASYGLGFDAINSNTFQDQLDQEASYKFGSLAAADPKARALAIAHNIECIEIGTALGSSALTVWVGDGTNFPGQQSLGGMFRSYLDSAAEIYAALPAQMSMFIEHKMYEPAFYSTVISDWGSSLMAAQALGPQAKCLVDLGHHAPNTNIEQIVARLIHAGKLAGFHFNDSKYGDDDLDAGAVDPFRLFLVFNELIEGAGKLDLAYMIDQSHNVTDPIESLMGSAIEIARAHVQARLVDRKALAEAQAMNDVLGAHRILKAAYVTDVSPILAEARMRQGGAFDPIATYRASGYRAAKAVERPAVKGASSGIV
ncbi:TIM barrel protein [Rhodobacter sp. KR11]|uniref:TIM barrel protein n=1 Tax=Rhodobacter sp. KR11 TaxID=2974588 RepID=UPI0022234F7A|nr:TIM barrel protein [Rhodobacter sp. KR11]MCW1920600.1 TIM barrel protein [Rhodobacter sp. KR11]